jgi:hypothetical protein
MLGVVLEMGPRRPARHRVLEIACAYVCVCLCGRWGGGGADVLFVVAKHAKRWPLPACFTAGQPTGKKRNNTILFRPWQGARRTLCIIRVPSVHPWSRALMAVSARFPSSALDTGDVDRHGTAQQGWLAHRPFFPAVRPKRVSQSRCSLVAMLTIRALHDGFSAPAWTRIAKHVAMATAVSQLPTAPTSVAHRRTTATAGFEKQRPFSIFPARAELLAVGSWPAQPDLMLLIGGGAVVARRSTAAHHT